MRESPTRKVLISEGLKALLAHGYDGVGIGTVLAAAGVPKGSFYHFFRSKEDFACALLDAYEAHYAQSRDEILDDPTHPPLTRLRLYFEARLEEVEAGPSHGGCLYGVLSQTAATRGPELRQKLSDCFDKWQQGLTAVLEEARDGGDLPRDLDTAAAAAFLIEAYEGAMVRMKADQTPAALDRFRRFALEPLLAGTGPA